MKLLTLPACPRILVVRRDNIGDLVCTTPALAALRRRFPKAQIAVLANSYNAQVLQDNPNIDHIFVYQKIKHAQGVKNKIKAAFSKVRLLIQLRRWSPDVTILAKSSYDRQGLDLLRMAGTNNKIGFVAGGYSQSVIQPDIALVPPRTDSAHEVEIINQLLAPLGINDALGPLEVFVDRSMASEMLKRLPPSECRIAVHISAREAERQWGAQKFCELIKLILEREPSAQVLMFWAPGQTDHPLHPGDDEMAKMLQEEVCNKRLIPMPTNSIRELVAALSTCDVFIGSDGGAMHIAAALCKNIVALFENRPGKLNHWYPWQVSSLVLCSALAEVPDVCGIEVSEVFQAYKKLACD